MRTAEILAGNPAASQPVTTTLVPSGTLQFCLVGIIGLTAVLLICFLVDVRENPLDDSSRPASGRTTALRIVLVVAVALPLAMLTYRLTDQQEISSKNVDAASQHVTSNDWMVTEQDVTRHFEDAGVVVKMVDGANTSTIWPSGGWLSYFRIELVDADGKVQKCEATVSDVSWRGAKLTSECTTGPSKFKPALVSKSFWKVSIPKGWKQDSGTTQGVFAIVSHDGKARMAGCTNEDWQGSDKVVLVCDGTVVPSRD